MCAMGIVSDDDFMKELENSSDKNSSDKVPSVLPEIIEMDRAGRKENDINVPDSLRKILGETSVIDGRQEAINLAREWGISPSSVSAYANGATSTKSYNAPKGAILNHINKSKERAVNRAHKTLNSALHEITPDKLTNTSARELAGVAKDMSVIIKNMEPAQQVETDKGPQFVIYAPQFKDERSFDVVVLHED